MLASSYPLLEVVWTMLIFFGLVIWAWILFTVLADLFRRHDTSGATKVLWIIFIITAPYFGVFVYLVAQHTGMAERAAASHKAAQAHVEEYLRSVGARRDPVERIAHAKELLDEGAINQTEFDQLKQQALAA
jgi:Phospholipase_D-nuclease N-terminal